MRKTNIKMMLGRGKLESGDINPATEEAGWVENEVTRHEPHGTTQIRS